MGRLQLYLLFLYPIASGPIFLAYGARYAFDTEMAFYSVLLIDLLIGIALYWIALQSAVQSAEERKEEILIALSSGQGPVGS